EVKRSILKQLGIDSSVVGTATVIGGEEFARQLVANNGPVESLLAGSGNNATASIGGNIGNIGLKSVIHAMEQAQVIRTLAEPTLTAISGEKADFHVGGEVYFATTVSNATGQQTLQGIQYGIDLGFTPVVLSPGRISLKINTEVSEPVAGAGGTFAKQERTANTSVELPSGGSIVIAGLLSNDSRQTISGAPGLSKIPILGTLFRSRDFVNNQTELVIIATPYLVHPVARNKLARPDDNFNVASDGAGYFLGRVNRIYGQMKTDLPDGRYHGVVGYIYK
ncbi:MAG TPA: pilus assembly protein CpaC, partial [Pararhizobium sp.]|nr:pilus assembly protein CpaC [Pararhizobium sp.]